ncbi:HhH-GPD-type base excision DNA repair protein [Paractinoplanes brasiliensis]|uniref:Putative HhH-GPD family protein n=1 Tax=Paractinoplanes brasiliensis TaxID=52695 RepID=A0A4R6JVR8_9ACTN|nr:HhH-GPD-type base excision DNA repair protein [Actinoplanes brasiliensis]TDO40850.1 putative HhH-GPD family protein [Actinoplanes brasiliensis]GID25918.1 (Fe-S)-cluster assembly protein [Actinoplanes brasiliensis]
MTLSLPIDAEANELLSHDPLALLIGMVLDQQIPLEKAFSSPYVLAQRLGHAPTAVELAEYDPDELIAIFAKPPALHRFPKAMAVRVQEVCRALVDRYDGDAANLWTGVADGTELLKRVASLPGFGKQKSQIFVALLGKQYGVQPAGWREAAGGYGEAGSFKSVADIVDDQSLGKVRAYKKEMKAAAKA